MAQRLHTIVLAEAGLETTEIPGICFLIENGSMLKSVNFSSNSFT